MRTDLGVRGVALATGGAECTCDVQPLHARNVNLVVDRDQAGNRSAATQAALLDGVAASVTCVQTPVPIDKADVVEHLAADLTLGDLVRVDFTPRYNPAGSKGDRGRTADQPGSVVGHCTWRGTRSNYCTDVIQNPRSVAYSTRNRSRALVEIRTCAGPSSAAQ